MSLGLSDMHLPSQMLCWIRIITPIEESKLTSGNQTTPTCSQHSASISCAFLFCFTNLSASLDVQGLKDIYDAQSEQLGFAHFRQKPGMDTFFSAEDVVLCTSSPCITILWNKNDCGISMTRFCSLVKQQASGGRSKNPTYSQFRSVRKAL